jgi:nitroreductase
MKDNDFIYIVTQAVKAPSTHNTQPWRFSRYGTDSILITSDKSRQLPASDSLGNELRISVQCAVYNAIVAALKHSIEAVSVKVQQGLVELYNQVCRERQSHDYSIVRCY